MLLILLAIATVIGACFVLYGTMNGEIEFTITGGIIALVVSLLIIFASLMMRGG